MTWEEAGAVGAYTEYERTDGHATVRLRERASGGFVVRLDRLEQAADGPEYRRETRGDRESAVALAEAWMDEFSVEK
ncbi:DUF7543 family protein [Halorarum halobium]|uniref:DUF7543 family protein n=1 Tax=Halorarum halobium TaxID=3075121 RepID=UPI0028AF37FA|nr:hypothetical protein [Halobaculum sp. XH14]